MDAIHSTANFTATKPVHWERHQVANLMNRIRFDQTQGDSLNQAALKNGVPRTTAQNWTRNRCQLDRDSSFSPATVEFFRITPRARVPT